jgi:hypothetical protein
MVILFLFRKSMSMSHKEKQYDAALFKLKQ